MFFSRGFGFSLRTFLWLWLCASALTSCSFSNTPKNTQHVFDFGPPVLPANAQKGSATVVVPIAESISGLDSTAINYRLGYKASNQPMSYADSHWITAPAQLLTSQIRDQLAQRSNVVSSSNNPNETLLQIELEEFSQVFDAPEQSRGLVAFRATLVRGGKLIGQRSFVAEEPAPSPDAAGGVAALSAASRSAVSSLAVWFGEMVP